MRKRQWMKHIIAAFAVMALAIGIVTPVRAEAPKVTLKSTKAYGQHTEGWTFTIPSKLPDGAKVMFNLYKDDQTESLSGSYRNETFDSSKAYQGPTKQWFYTEEGKFVIDGTETSTYIEKSYAPGTYKVDIYYFDGVAYKAAVEAKLAELKQTYSDVRLRNSWWQESYEARCEYHSYVTGEYNSAPLATIYMADYIVPAGSFTLKMDLNEPGVSSAVKSTSVQLNLSKSVGTGYEIYRKEGNSYKKIETTTKNVYTDKNLTSKTKYSYKVRVYYKDKKTGKISYGPYTVHECTTRGSALNLKLTVQGKKNVKLTWNKIAGAKQYKVYRRMADSDLTAYSKGGVVGDGFGKWELLKTLGSGKKSYTDKKTAVDCAFQYMVVAVLPKDGSSGEVQIDDSKSVSFYFGDMNITAEYTDATGNRTVEWNKSYGAKGYIVEKKVIDAATQSYTWEQVTKLSASATKYKFVAKKLSDIKADAEGKYDLTETYRIYPYKDNGATVGESHEYTTIATLGIVKNVKAKKVANGIQVTWTPVEGAAYYEVYRMPAMSIAKNKDVNGYVVAYPSADEYDNEYYTNETYGSKVTQYVGAKKPVAVDVAAWNAAVDAFNNDTTGTVARPMCNWKLDETKTYYYQNYEYATSEFTDTSVIDYAGEIYGGSIQYCGYWDQANMKQIERYAMSPVEVSQKTDYYKGAEPGITYQYYVIAYAAKEKTWQDYKNDGKSDEEAQNSYGSATELWVTTPGTTDVVKQTKRVWKSYSSSYTCSSLGEANYSFVSAPSGKPTIKSITSAKKTVTIKLKKKVKGAVAYRVYRATKKKGKYVCVGVTTSITFKDTGLSAGKTYYYKVVPIAASEAGEDIAGKASAVKSIKVKK
ncbi:MAG: hypothetical protein IJP29_04260 [Lachnospiraceae bacterium]|nr:hypothetical protein [Lachnospiraceae bacterium]